MSGPNPLERALSAQDRLLVSVAPTGELVISAASVKSRSIRWPWKGRIAGGYLTVQTGEEGLGKSTFAAWQIARMTRGELEGEWEGEPVTVLVIASEDGIGDTWIPRLDLAGAGLARVKFLALDRLGPDWNLRDGIAAVRAALIQTCAKFVYVDAALEHMPAPTAGESINSPTFVRGALAPLRTLVRELDIAAEFSMHPPKARGAGFRDLVQASQAFSAIPRIGLLIAWHPEDDTREPDRRRVLVRGKGNLGRDPGAIEFRIVGRDYLHDDGRTQEREVVVDVRPSGITLADLRPGAVMGTREPTKVERAAEIVAAELADGEWHEAQPIRDRLRAQGLNHNAVVDDAKRRVGGVKARQRPGVAHGGWEWRASPDPVVDSNGSESTTDSETLIPLARGVLPDTDSDPPKPLVTPLGSVRVSESADGNVQSGVAGQSQSADELRASDSDRDAGAERDAGDLAERPSASTEAAVLPDGLLRAVGRAVQDAGGDMRDVDDLVDVWQRLGRDLDRRASAMRGEAKRVRCACADGGEEPTGDGRCSRCYGSLREPG
jgi:hypothetical protein